MTVSESTLFSQQLDCDLLNLHIENIARLYPFIKIGYIGNTLLGRKIPLLCFGVGGGHSVMYLGGEEADDGICPSLLLKFLYDICRCKARGETLFGTNIPYLFESRKIYVLPMLNLDGKTLNLYGKDDKNPLTDRIEKLSCGNFSKWRANSRGVDLKRNYNVSFKKMSDISFSSHVSTGVCHSFCGEYPESEPEVSSVSNFLRYTEPSLLMSFDTDGEGVIVENSSTPHTSRLVSHISAITSQKVEYAKKDHIGVSGWYAKETGKSAVSVSLKQEDGERTYRLLRQLLFSLPSIM